MSPWVVVLAEGIHRKQIHMQIFIYSDESNCAVLYDDRSPI